MAKKSLVSIAGYDLPNPSSYTGGSSTLVDSARNTAGVVIGSVIREDVAKIELSWNYLTTEQWARILKCFNSAYGGNFYNEVTFFNHTSGTYETRTFYVGDRTSSGVFMLDDDGVPIGWKNPKLNLIEV